MLPDGFTVDISVNSNPAEWSQTIYGSWFGALQDNMLADPKLSQCSIKEMLDEINRRLDG